MLEASSGLLLRLRRDVICHNLRHILKLDMRDRRGELAGNSSRRSRRGGLDSEAGTLHDKLAEFRQGNSLSRIDLKDALKNAIKFRRDRKNAGKVIWVVQVSFESRIFTGSLFPRIPAACQIDQNDSKAPHIAWGRIVAITIILDAFYGTRISMGSKLWLVGEGDAKNKRKGSKKKAKR